MEEVLPTRQVFWNIDAQWVMYFLFVCVIIMFLVSFLRKVRLWHVGREDNRAGLAGIRLMGVLRDSILQIRVLGEKSGGIVHLLMYMAIIVLLVATVTVAIDADLGIPVARGNFYLYFLSLVVDIAGALLCVGVLAAAIRRIVQKKKGLETKAGDIIILVTLFLIGITGFCVEGLRIAATDDVWKAWSPVGNAVASYFLTFDESGLTAAHRILWWIHLILAFAILATAANTKLVHALLIPLDVYYRQLNDLATLPYMDVEDETSEGLCVEHVDDFTWKDLLDAEACIRCSRCINCCPAHLSGKTLSPMGFVQNIKSQLEREAQQGKFVEPVVENAISRAALWECTTCGSCVQHCPSRIEIPQKIIKLRSHQVLMEGEFPSEAQAVFRAFETQGNPWGLGWQKRTAWLEELGVQTLEQHPDAEYVYWPGCFGAYDTRTRKVSIALVKILQAAGVDFAIIGNEERCCGETARRMGNEYAYTMLASANIEILNSYGVKKIIVQCPHCLTSLAVDYPQLGGHYEVVHHSQLICQLLDQGKLKLKKPSCISNAVYHDPCYLGRYRNVYDEPRRAIKAAGHVMVEPSDTKEGGLCCGAGGGRMWLEENTAMRVNDLRVRQLLESAPDEIVCSCPFCLTMLSDGIRQSNEKTPVFDIAELICQSLE